MKNLKTLGMLLTMLLIGSVAYAQISVNIGTGYHSGAFKMSGEDATTTTVKDGNTTVENIYYSLGGGLPINIGVGIPVGDNMEVNADFCYWMGSTVTTMEGDATVDIGGGNTLTQTGMTSVTSNQIRFMPGITYTTESGLYGRTALVLPLGGKTTFTMEEKEVNSGNGNETFTNAEGESTGNFSLGASAALGYNIPIGDAMQLGLELQALALNIKSATQSLTSYEDNNGTTLDDIPTFIAETNFVDELDDNSNVFGNDDFDPDKAGDALAGMTSFGAWGFNIRFVYTLGN